MVPQQQQRLQEECEEQPQKQQRLSMPAPDSACSDEQGWYGFCMDWIGLGGTSAAANVPGARSALLAAAPAVRRKGQVKVPGIAKRRSPRSLSIR